VASCVFCFHLWFLHPPLCCVSLMMVVGARKLWSLVMSLSVREESFLVELPLNSHGGSPCNDSIAAITQYLKCPRK
jgi:hypothetical protein